MERIQPEDRRDHRVAGVVGKGQIAERDERGRKIGRHVVEQRDGRVRRSHPDDDVARFPFEQVDRRGNGEGESGNDVRGLWIDEVAQAVAVCIGKKRRGSACDLYRVLDAVVVRVAGIRPRAGEELLEVRQAVAIEIQSRVVAIRIKAVGDLEAVGHSVAVGVEERISGDQ